MTVEEIHTLTAGGLMEIGAHTVHHPLLSRQNVSQQTEEIGRSKSDLERVLGQPVTSFAYPFGVYGQETLDIVRAAGFSCACSTVEETVWHRNDCFALPRFEVRGCSKNAFERRLQAWLRM
jgi:peptidoglycan/xylan/chitin deacetylase (PgdA/CDA1 family)